ncbi:uncharacterized protein F5891DRAFT_1179709 [Suillus fuscotomentosus]|uniref:CCHC-type domain-containing protein n=1 Tax=Suillus fuscotomentosus TaxID=1912939 RepID=A0AAD4EL45_9AGAM|nr:uncharacterized protein F5891DRAFT_1179709 [Suillus fuscotomentosus]KAG1908197.1 hypothetical protein F5891DRAFT_1179709 [Suillus fuscotomentosus]
MTPPQTPLPTESTTSHLSLHNTFYKQNIINVEDDVIIETTLLSLAHAEELEKQLAKEPTHLAAPILSQIHIIHTTSSLKLKLNNINDDALRLSCQHLQRHSCSLTIQLLLGSFIGHPPSATISTASASISATYQAREDHQPLPIPPPNKVYQRKTCGGAVVCEVTKTKSSKGKRHKTIDLTTDPTTSTITVKQPNLSADNFICHLCKNLGHRHKNCPKYHCQVCQAHTPGHFSIYCPYAPKKDQFPLVYTDEGFYDALAE